MLCGGKRRHQPLGSVLCLHYGDSARISAHYADIRREHPYDDAVVGDEYHVLVLGDRSYAADLALELVYTVVEHSVAASVLQAVVIHLDPSAIALVCHGQDCRVLSDCLQGYHLVAVPKLYRLDAVSGSRHGAKCAFLKADYHSVHGGD